MNGDIVVTTSYKCGTTFTQQILYNMLVRNTANDEVFPALDEVSPWVDARFWPVSKDELKQWLPTVTQPRFLKSHLPLDGLPYFDHVKYIIVGRDPRDVFMSLVNHYGNYTDLAYEAMQGEGLEPIPRFDGDIKGLWRNWISKGWFEWEQEGYPFWSNMHHTQSYWDYRHLPNFLFVHYADLRSDLEASIRTIAHFVECDLSDTEVTQIASAVSFDKVKAQAVNESSQTSREKDIFKGGQATFINKGTNNRWRDVLSAEDLSLYEATRDRVLTPECAAWLEH